MGALGLSSWLFTEPGASKLVTMAALARLYLDRTNVECVAIDEAAPSLALDLLDRHALGRQRFADMLLAATLLTNGVTHIVTCNADDFRIVDALAIIDPRGSP